MRPTSRSGFDRLPTENETVHAWEPPMEILFTLALLLVFLFLWFVDPLYFLIALLVVIALGLLDVFARRPGLLWTVLGIGILFSLLNGDDDDDDCDM
jgi:peptidoglycan/LPS O-acetylase OafA/YrhL